MNARIAALLRSVPAVIAIGAGHFADSLRAQGVTVVRLDWRPPPSEQVRRALDRLL